MGEAYQTDLFKMNQRLVFLKDQSKYPTQFEVSQYEVYFEKLAHAKSQNFLLKDPFHNIHESAGCLNCYQAFQLDTFGEGCLHNCFYCFAKHTLEAEAKWNVPLPLPCDITELWEIFYTVFETSKVSPWRETLEKRTSLRIGGFSDSFMKIERDLGVTKEFLKILNYYQYPYFIVTKSPLVAQDDYLKLLSPELSAVHISLPSISEEALKRIEPQAPSANDRLQTIEKLAQNNIWTTVRINPLFPCYKDGHFSKNSGSTTDTPELEIFSFQMLDELAKRGVKSIISGFVSIEEDQFPLRNLPLLRELKELTFNSSNNFKFSEKEVSCYYQEISKKCHSLGMRHNTCYLGEHEFSFFRYQKFCDNKKDCCDVIGNVPSHKVDSKQVAPPNIVINKISNPLIRFLTSMAQKLLRFIIDKSQKK